MNWLQRLRRRMKLRKEKRRLLKKIRKIAMKNPELRICQIVAGAAVKTGQACPEIFYRKDKELEQGLDNLFFRAKKQLKLLKARRSK